MIEQFGFLAEQRRRRRMMPAWMDPRNGLQCPTWPSCNGLGKLSKHKPFFVNPAIEFHIQFSKTIWAAILKIVSDDSPRENFGLISYHSRKSVCCCSASRCLHS